MLRRKDRRACLAFVNSLKEENYIAGSSTFAYCLNGRIELAIWKVNATIIDYRLAD